MPRSFDKAVILVIDALRYDFAVPHAPQSSGSDAYQPFHNALTILHEKATQEPQNAVLFPFIADPPTTTLQRLKGLMTGTLPTFIEAGANFAGSALSEDNFVTQLQKAGKRLVHLGDDTWTKLFPNHFLPNLSRAYDSFLVADLHTVDQGVREHVIPLISHHQDEWDVIFGHLLGVDHVGHRFGPAHPEMCNKLKEMNRVIGEIVNSIDENTLLVVLGDHGMDEHGNHGGETENEVQAALWMYTRRKHFGHLLLHPQRPASYLNKSAIYQIDLAPTLSLLLGIPIPFNNLGSPIKEAFLGAAGDNWGQLVHAHMLSFAQIERFHREYSRMKNAQHDLEHNHTNFPRSVSLQELDFQDKESLKTLYHELRDHQGNILEHYKRIWARFNIAYMVEGLTILSFGAVALLLRVCVWGQCNLSPSASSRAIKRGAATSIATYLIHIVIVEPEEPRMTDGVILGATMSSLMLFTYRFHLFGMIQAPTKSQMPNFLDAIAIAFTILLSIGFASNSYTIWEDQIVLVFLATFGIYTISMSYRTWDRRKNIIEALLSVSFMALVRVVSLSRYCREEQLPFCVTTYHRLGNAMGWRLLIPYLIIILIPLATRIAFGSNLISKNLGVWIWCHIGIPMALFFNAVYWTLDSANRYGWLEGSRFNMLLSKGPHIFFSRATLVTAIAGSGMALTTKWTTTMTPVRYNMIITTSILVISILVSGPMGGGSLSILYFQILSLRKLLSHSQNHTIGPTIAAFLGTLHFFGTGHNATLSSIQWEAAYILSQDLHYLWSPLLVTLNTFAGPIVSAFSIPLIISRDVQPQEVQSVTNSVAIHVLIYSVWALSTAIWASILRRHLMLFAIFCPRFLMAGALLLIIDVIAIIISLITAVNTK